MPHHFLYFSLSILCIPFLYNSKFYPWFLFSIWTIAVWSLFLCSRSFLFFVLLVEGFVQRLVQGSVGLRSNELDSHVAEHCQGNNGLDLCCNFNMEIVPRSTEEEEG